MISKLTNLYKKNDFEEQKSFQNRVLNLLQKNYPDVKFSKSDDPLIIFYDENKLGLSNLYAQFLLTTQTNYELMELAAEHFEKVFGLKDLIENIEKSWEETRSLILPQLMPVEYSAKYRAIGLPFGGEVNVGFVIDDEKAYRYVTEEDLKNWSVGEAELRTAAIGNLAQKSSNLEMTFIPPPNGMFVINTMDSFDAARILLPSLQAFFGEKLGKPFYFGVPNRDFLICGSHLGVLIFKNFFKKQIADYF
jgi:uncharacterized protein YtpQ (UPF0354 family)